MITTALRVLWRRYYPEALKLFANDGRNETMPASTKGSDFEREMCRLFSLWWTDRARDDVFWRAATSGGRATIRGQKGRATFGQYGDIAAVDPIGRPLLDVVTIELKCGYSAFSIADLLDRAPGVTSLQFELFLHQATAAAELAKTAWLLVVKRNQRPACVFFPAHLLWRFSALQESTPFLVLRDQSVPDQIAATTLTNFFKVVKPSAFLKKSRTTW